MARLWRVPRIRPSPELPPVVQSVTPNAGSDVGGEVVDIRGIRFIGATQVRFGTLAAAGFTVVDYDRIIAVTPAHAAGAVGVKVTTPGGTHTLANAYTYTSSGSAPTVIAIVAAIGPAAGGTLVTIQVNDSTGCTGASVGGVALSGFVIVDPTHVRGTTGVHAAGTVDVQVTNGVGTGTLVGGFRYITAPSIASLNYDQGQPEGGGAAMIITGSDLSDGTGVAPTVSVSGGASVAATGWGAGFVSFNLPARAAGAGYTVSVTHAGGTSGTLAFEYWKPANLGTAPSLHLRAESNTGYAVAAGNGTWLDVSGNGRNFSHATLAPPTGATVQGHTPPDPSGVAGTDKLTHASTVTTFFGASLNKYAVWTLAKRDTVPSPGLTSFTGQAILNDTSGFMGVGFGDDGAGALCAYGYHWDAASKEAIKHSLATGTWYLVLVWVDASGGASPVHIEVNGSAGTDSANANALGGGGSMVALSNYSAAVAGHDGPVLELGTVAAYNLTAGERLKLLKYCRQRYGLALT